MDREAVRGVEGLSASQIRRARVDVPGVETMRAPQRQREACGMFGRRDQMDMVRCQAIGPAGRAEVATLARSQVLNDDLVVIPKGHFGDVETSRVVDFGQSRSERIELVRDCAAARDL